MARNITIEEFGGIPVEKQMIEMVERKGMGHPDSLSDGIAEAVSRALSKEYIKRYGVIMHHNTDQAEVIAGQSKPKFGGGEVLEAITFLVCGRATTHIDKEEFPVGTIAREAVADYLSKNTRLDVEADAEIEIRIGQGSTDLRDVFGRKGMPAANDTSFGVGFAPFSDCEKLVYETERMLNSKEYKAKMPAVGEDIKVMGLRNKDALSLTVAIAFVDKFVPSLEAYFNTKKKVEEDITAYAKKFTKKEVKVRVNTADSKENKSVYLTVTGLSCENGDDGSVGRGNRSNGIIAPFRTMSLEATSGKNPVNHVGKLYNLLSNQIAADVLKVDSGIKSSYVRILSAIGEPIDQPQNASVQLVLEKTTLSSVKERVNSVVDKWLANISSITKDVVAGKLATF